MRRRLNSLQNGQNRTGCDIIAQSEGSDPAAVILTPLPLQKPEMPMYCSAIRQDVCTTKNLMEELRKIDRVIEREYADAYRENLIVLDATTGQNALSQLKEFKRSDGYYRYYSY